MPALWLLAASLALAAEPSPVTTALLESLGPERAATLRQPPELEPVALAIRAEEKPAAKAALARLERAGDASLRPEIARAYLLIGDSASAARLQPSLTAPDAEVQRALALVRNGDYETAYAEAVALNQKYPGRSDVASLLAATRGRGRTSSHQTKAPSPDAASANAVAAPATPSKNIVFSENTRRRSFSDAPPDIDLSANFPGEPPPRSSGDVPLWPLVPIGLLSAGGYTVARRQKTLEAHDEPEEAEPPSKGERFLAGAVVAGFAGAALYYTAASAVLLAPAAMRALSGGGQQAIRIAQSQSGKVDLNRAGRVALDTNAIIARLEGAPADVIAVVQALGSRNPVVSRMAVREFVRGGGDMNKLREFLRQSGGGLGKAPSQQTVDELLRLGLKPADARVVGSAIEEGIPIMTRDDKILRKMGEAAERF